MRRINKIKSRFISISAGWVIKSRFYSPKFVRAKCIRVSIFDALEYNHMYEGRCISVRSRGKITSILVRNKKYGVEQRIFVNNPRVLLYY